MCLAFLCTKIIYCTLLCRITPYCTLLHLIVPYYVLLHPTVPHCTPLHLAVPPPAAAQLRAASGRVFLPSQPLLIISLWFIATFPTPSCRFSSALPPRPFSSGGRLVFALTPPQLPQGPGGAVTGLAGQGGFFLLPVFSGTEADKQGKQPLPQPS